jgi:hypothetical protein
MNNFSVMFKNGRANPILEKIWHKFPLKENKAVSIDLSSADIKAWECIGQIGDEINVLMAACAWNLRKWMVAVAIFLFWKKVGLFFVKYPRFFVVR